MDKVATVSQQFRENQYAQYAVFGAGAALVTLAIGATFARMVSPQVRYGSIFSRRFVAVTMVMGASTVAAGAFLKFYGAEGVAGNPDKANGDNKPIPEGLDKIPVGPLPLKETDGKDLKTVAQEAANLDAKIQDPLYFRYQVDKRPGTFWGEWDDPKYVTVKEDHKVELPKTGNLYLLANGQMQEALKKLEQLLNKALPTGVTLVSGGDHADEIFQKGGTVICLGEDTARVTLFRLSQLATDDKKLDGVSVLPMYVDNPTKQNVKLFEKTAQGVFSFAS